MALPTPPLTPDLSSICLLSDLQLSESDRYPEGVRHAGDIELRQYWKDSFPEQAQHVVTVPSKSSIQREKHPPPYNADWRCHGRTAFRHFHYPLPQRPPQQTSEEASIVELPTPDLCDEASLSSLFSHQPHTISPASLVSNSEAEDHRAVPDPDLCDEISLSPFFLDRPRTISPASPAVNGKVEDYKTLLDPHSTKNGLSAPLIEAASLDVKRPESEVRGFYDDFKLVNLPDSERRQMQGIEPPGRFTKCRKPDEVAVWWTQSTKYQDPSSIADEHEKEGLSKIEVTDQRAISRYLQWFMHALRPLLGCISSRR